MTERTHVSRRHIQLTTCKERKNGQHLPNFYLFVEIMVLGGASWQFRTWALRGFSLLLAWHNCLLNEKTKAHAAYMVFIRRALITSGQPVIGGWSYQKSSFYSSTSTHNKTHYQLLCPQWLGLFFAHHGEPFYQILGAICQWGEILYTPLINGVILHFWRHQRVQCSCRTNSSFSVKIFFRRTSLSSFFYKVLGNSE